MTEKNDADLVLNYLSEVEAVAEEILASKQHLIELDKKRQKSREAIRFVIKQDLKKIWLQLIGRN